MIAISLWTISVESIFLHLTGPASLYVRSSRYNHSYIATHVTDTHAILCPHMEVASRNSFILVSDGGPDLNPASVLNQIYLYRLFKILELNLLSICMYAARYSAFNPIEHLWLTMSKKLAEVIFSPTIEDKNNPPLKSARPHCTCV